MQHLGHDTSTDMRPLKMRPFSMKINFCASHCLKFPVPQDWPEPTPLHQGPAPRHLGELPARRSEASPAQELPVIRTEASLDAEPKGAVQTKSLAEKPAAVHNRSLAKEPADARNPNLAEEPAAVHNPSLAEEPALLQLSTLPETTFNSTKVAGTKLHCTLRQRTNFDCTKVAGTMLHCTRPHKPDFDCAKVAGLAGASPRCSS